MRGGWGFMEEGRVLLEVFRSCVDTRYDYSSVVYGIKMWRLFLDYMPQHAYSVLQATHVT